LHVACTANRGWVPHVAAMLDSVLAQRGGLEVHVHFLHGDDVGADDRERVTDMVRRGGGEISFLFVDDERVADLWTHPVLPASAWYNVFLPDLLPELDRVLYLDGDVIVLDSLAPLWETELGDHYLAAVTNVLQQDHFPRLDDLGLSGPEVYFNAGVMLMNLGQLRREDGVTAVVEWARANPDKIRWPPQDALNVALGSRRLPLHPRWNCMNSVVSFPWSAELFGAEAVEEARRNPAIRHFEGPAANKPWHYLADRESRELYLRHRRRTPWPEFRPVGRTPRNVWKRLRERLPLSA
jgi:lipopolysaccharide biosynthesis glycosyltransferase